MKIKNIDVVICFFIISSCFVKSQTYYWNGVQNDLVKSQNIKTISIAQNNPEKVEVNSAGVFSLGYPLMVVPGRNGMSFNLNISYQPGIRVFQEAGWVGLGWNLSTGCITRTPIVRTDAYVSRSTSVFDEYRDEYSLVFPQGSGKILQYPVSGTNYFDFQMEETKPWKITYDEVKHRFVVVTEDGTKYVFSQWCAGFSSNVGTTTNGTYNESSYDFPGQHNGLFPIGEPIMKWYLTAILSQDYIDGNPNNEATNDPLNPLDTPYPAKENKGSWIAVEYDDGFLINDAKKWYYLANSTGSGLKDVSLDEITYPYKIITPSHVAVLQTEPEEENLVTYLREHSFYNYNPGSVFLDTDKNPSNQSQNYDELNEKKRRLISIELFRYYGQGNQTVGSPISGVRFSYISSKPRSMLKEVRQYVGTSELPGLLCEYYDVPLQPNYLGTDPYSTRSLFGWYASTNNGGTTPVGVSEDGRAWNLKKIIYPTGGYLEFDYESHKYIDDTFTRGARLKSQKIYDGAQSITYSYDYASFNSIGQLKDCGVKSILPIQYYTEHCVPNYSTSHLVNVLYAAIDTKLLYGRIIETNDNDISKTVRYYISPNYDDYGSSVSPENATTIFSKTHGRRGQLGREEFYEGSTLKLSKIFTYTQTVNRFYEINSGAGAKPFHISYLIEMQNIVQADAPSGPAQNTYIENNSNGLVRTITEVNADGKQRITKYKYASDYSQQSGSHEMISVLSTMRSKNMIGMPIEKTVIEKMGGNEKVVASNLTMFKTLNGSQVYQSKIMALLNTVAVTDFIYSDVWSVPYSQSMFLYDPRYTIESDFIDYDEYGNLIKSSDANGNFFSRIWGYNSSLQVAEISDAQVSQTGVGASSSFVGFETGLASQGTNSNEDFWSLYNGQTASTDAHTGQYSWRVPAGNPVYGPTRDFLPPSLTEQNKTYILSCWVKTEPGFGANKGIVILHSKENTDGNNTIYPNVTGASKSISFSDTDGKWKYIEVEIDLATVRLLGGISNGTNLRIRAFPYNTDANKYFLIDDLRFHAKGSGMRTYTYNERYQINSKSNENNIPIYFEYDDFSRLQYGLDYDKRKLHEREYYYSRSGNNDSYNNVDPNFTQITENNLVKNWSFEKKTSSNNLQDWVNGAQQVTFEQDKYTGKKAIKVFQQNNQWSAIYQTIGVLKAGKTYTASVWFKAPTNVRGQIFFGDSFDPNPYENSVSQEIYGTGSWQRLSVTRTLTKDELMLVYLYGKDNSGVLYDAVIIEESTLASVMPQVSTSYMDGLGRTIQTQTRNGNNEIVSAVFNDNYGREKRTYLPYENVNSLHTYDATFVANSQLQNPNAGDYPYQEKKYFADPLNNIAEIGFPGIVFSIDNAEKNNVRVAYGTNNSSEVDGFPEYSLYKTITTSENDNVHYQYRDLLGNVVQTNANVVTTVTDVTSQNLITKFNYDILGNLTKSIPPKGESYSTTYSYNTQSQLTSKTSPDAGTVEYRYDKNGNLRFVKDANHQSSGEPNQLVESFFIEGDNSTVNTGDFTLQLPGKLNIQLFPIDLYSDEVLTVKIKKGNVVLLSKTTNYYDYYYVSGSIILPKGDYSYEAVITGGYYGQFNYNLICESGYEFIYKKYDALNRIIEEGEYESSAPTNFTQANAENITFPTTSTLVSKKLYYDQPSTSPHAWGQRNLKGRLSYSYSYRLGEIADESYYSYDDYGKVEWVVKYQHGYFQKKLVYEYDLQGNITKRGYVDPVTNRNMFTFFEYDQAGRLSKVYVGANTNGTGKTLEVQYTYTASGKVKQQILGNNLQTVDFTYNERDWLTKINDVHFIGTDKFAQQLHYYDNESGIGAANQYNGNISWISYNTPNYPFTPAGGSSTTKLANQFSYDGANRLTNANFKWFGWDPVIEDNIWRETSSFDENYSYDQNGNFLTLNRNTSNGTASNIAYTYQNNTNKLTNATGGTYQYDANGNVISDSYRNIAFVIYDIYNLPVTMYKTNGQQQFYSYDATGGRIRKYAIGGGTDTYYMIGPDGKTEIVQKGVYNNNYTYNLYGNDNFAHVNVTSSQANKFYYLKDHLGNNRVTINSSGTQVGYDDLTPFGMTMDGRSATSSADARFKFTGKERDSYETGYDYFGARYYDSRMGRWMAVDPLSSKYPSSSPYNYTDNNPIVRFDVDGGFYADIHASITINALGGLVNPLVLSAIVTQNIAQDIPTIYKEHEHADNESFDATSDFLNDNLNKSVASLGKSFHALQDFYSHSNFVELKLNYFGSEKTLTFKEAMKDAGFVKLWNKEGKGGYYPDSETPKDKVSHAAINKDTKDKPFHKEAVEAATKATKEYYNEWRLKRDAALRWYDFDPSRH